MAEEQIPRAASAQPSLDVSPSKINGERSPARIISSKLSVVGDNNSQISVPLGFVNPEGEAEKDLKKNGESAKVELPETEALDKLSER
jgi:hypothetical protein